MSFFLFLESVFEIIFKLLRVECVRIVKLDVSLNLQSFICLIGEGPKIPLKYLNWYKIILHSPFSLKISLSSTF